jgi:hypothetical protein
MTESAKKTYQKYAGCRMPDAGCRMPEMGILNS